VTDDEFEHALEEARQGRFENKQRFYNELRRRGIKPQNAREQGGLTGRTFDWEPVADDLAQALRALLAEGADVPEVLLWYDILKANKE
jgi:hypothetical protein